MTELADGESAEVKGSAAKPYILRNVGGIYSCSCPSWRNQSEPIERRTCKHLGAFRGEKEEAIRIGTDPAPKAKGGHGSITPKERGSEPPLLLAHAWDHAADLTGWWMSEKLDGVRAYWDGKRFLSRQGNQYHAPKWFTKDLPKTPLDGELWLARQSFQRTVSIVRRQDQSDDWKALTYVVFDAPGLDSPFEARQSSLRHWVSVDSSYVQVLHQQVCLNLNHLQAELAKVIEDGGEGLMLRKPGSFYEVGRSYTLIKVKTFFDEEATVIEHIPGLGKHTGRMGALVVELSNGVRFSVGTGFSDAERRSPPPIGSLITFRYQELTDRGVPRFPSFVRIRNDLNPISILDVTWPTRSKTSDMVSDNFFNEKGKVMTGKFRRFEFVDDKSSKFWEIRIEGTATEVRYGRIGTSGQVQQKEYASEDVAALAGDKLIREKTKSGYLEVSETGKPTAAEKSKPKKEQKGGSTKNDGVVEDKVIVSEHPDIDKTIKTLCISGKLPSGKKKADYEKALQAINIRLVDDVSSSLTYLVVAEPSSTTGKAQKARAMGIPILSEDELIQMVGGIS